MGLELMVPDSDDASRDRISELLADWANGDPAARERLVPIVYEELRRLAHHYMRGERSGHTLQGTGGPLILIPYLAADHACYAFQVAEYAKHFTCFSLDLRGTGESDKPEGAYTTEDLADDAVAFMQAAGIRTAHVAGLSLGAAVGMWLAAKYPEKVESLSLHGAWPKTDAFQQTIVEGWQVMARALGVQDMIVRAIFPWCFTPELYASRPDWSGIRNSELLIFERCARAALYENVEEFNQETLQFLQRQATSRPSRSSAHQSLSL